MRYFLFLFIVALSVGTIVVFSCTTMTQKEMAEAERVPMNSDYDWMHRMDWYTGNVLGQANEDEDYSPASAIFYDKNKETGLCYAFYGRSFHQAPSWACKK